MMTLVKRDFRGFLLSNIIDFIDSKAKEYSSIIFNTNELDFKLEGNNIDISFCNKMLESLSGGEKQKVNLIIQFAIRDMMSNNFNKIKWYWKYIYYFTSCFWIRNSKWLWNDCN